jgi:hypothetical protein
MAAKTPVSLASLNVRKVTDTPREVEYFGPDLKPTGVFLSILGAQSETVQTKTNAILNERRQKAAAQAAEMAAARTVPVGRAAAAQEVAFTPVEEDFDQACRMSAACLVGWRGIEEAYTEELALQLIKSNPHIKAQVDAVSMDLATFMKASPKG